MDAHTCSPQVTWQRSHLQHSVVVIIAGVMVLWKRTHQWCIWLIDPGFLKGTCCYKDLYKIFTTTWWRHQMEAFSALLALCAGNSPVTGEFPSQRSVTRSFDVFFDLRLNKRLSKQSWAWWFETPSCPLWRHCIDLFRWFSIRLWYL